ncbi:peptidoglycan DD-metalloendopeptidase family protein [Desulfobulbus sp. F1]|nr:peptidoglycan DD-metalloendopeptidase family protein [Desulfobulbus sp. F1]
MIIKGYSSIPERLHLVVTGETGKALSFVIERDRAAVLLAVLLFLLTALTVGTWLGTRFFQEKRVLAVKAVSQERELKSFHSDFEGQLQQELAIRERNWQEQAAAYQTQINALQQEKKAAAQHFSAEQERLICRYEEELATISTAGSAKTAHLLAELEQAQQDKQELIEKTAGRLDERSRMIETMMSQIGVDVKVSKKPNSNSGGPFVAVTFDERFSERLLTRSDRYIKAIQQMPLGLPARGRITSGFGRRSDPFNGQLAFHAGIDFKGGIGDNVTATAEGVVKEAGWDQGGFGNYVVVRHGNGYETLFAHLSKTLVNTGDAVSRGDAVGLLGNSGRSTGPHLHYEVHYKGKAVDPEKYLSVADLSFIVPM